MSPPSDQSLPLWEKDGVFLSSVSFLVPATGLLPVQEGPVPTLCTYLHTLDTPHLGLHGQHLRSSGPPPCLLPVPAARAPGSGGGAGGTLTSGDVISALGERRSTLWMRPSLLVGGRGEGGREGPFPLSPGHGGHLGRNQGGINQTLMFMATIPRG